MFLEGKTLYSLGVGETLKNRSSLDYTIQMVVID